MPYPKKTSKLDFLFKEMKTKNGSGHMGAGKNDDLYNYPRRLEKNKQALAKMRNGQVALAFLDHLFVLGLSLARVSKYSAQLRTILRLINFPPKDATKQDIEKIVAWIQEKDYAEWTRHDLKLILKKFIQYAKNGSCDKQTPVPPEVAWIPLNVKKQDTVTSEDLLTLEEIEKILRNTRNARDQAMLYSLFEGALRPEELLTMRVGSVEFAKGYCLLSVTGKTGHRRITVVLAYRALLNWLQEHPYRSDPNAPLWVSLSTNGEQRRLHYSTFREIVKNTAKKAGITKRVWGYLFRHTYLTDLAKKFTEAQLKGFAGWTQSSKMAGRYVHLSGRDNEDAVLILHRIKNPEEQNCTLTLRACPNCGEKNEPATIRCIRCGLILDQKMAYELRNEEEKKREQMLNRIENLEKLVLSVLNQKASV
jgi:integrase